MVANINWYRLYQDEVARNGDLKVQIKILKSMLERAQKLLDASTIQKKEYDMDIVILSLRDYNNIKKTLRGDEKRDEVRCPKCNSLGVVQCSEGYRCLECDVVFNGGKSS